VTYNLTDTQQELARWLVAERKAGRLDEFFSVSTDALGRAIIRDSTRFPFTEEGARILLLDCPSFTHAALDALAADGMLLAEGSVKKVRRFTFRRRLFDAVRNDFRDATAPAPHIHMPSGIPAMHLPQDLALPLERLRKKFPDASKLGFLVPPACGATTGKVIFHAIRSAAARHGLILVSAEEHPFHANPWTNLRTLMHACAFGIVVHEYSGGTQAGADLGLQIGYLLALNKPALVLRGSKAVAQTGDIMQSVCEEFDEDDAARTVTAQVETWLRESGIIVPSAVAA